MELLPDRASATTASISSLAPVSSGDSVTTVSRTCMDISSLAYVSFVASVSARFASSSVIPLRFTPAANTLLGISPSSPGLRSRILAAIITPISKIAATPNRTKMRTFSFCLVIEGLRRLDGPAGCRPLADFGGVRRCGGNGALLLPTLTR